MILMNKAARYLLMKQRPTISVMENRQKTDMAGNVRTEDDYEAHQADPAPAPEAVEEPNDRPAGNTIKWAIAIAIALLAIAYFVFVQ